MSTRHPPLSLDLRNRLAKAVLEARHTGEAAGRQSLEALAVGRHKPHDSMTLAEKALRNRLRARGRQLGDPFDRSVGTQEIDRLAHEVAYEQWHQMLFARFLAENGLLIEPEGGVPVSLDECEDLARERGEDLWALAGGFAERMLPGVFRQDAPVLEVALPPEARLRLEGLLESLPSAVFLAADSLGWTYQFWQAERKDQVNRSGVKIGADELPAVTQLFTERYMVLFLFHNTIGAWRAGKLLSEADGGTDDRTEDDLRRAVRVEAGDGYDFSYLRFARDEDEAWRPAAGWFEGWPRTAAELRVLDPCCGSGHFLVEGLELLVRLRMEEEGLAVRDAVRAVLRDNLHGLEIDPRCSQIAAFNLAFAAYRLVGRPFELPPLNIACCGLAPNSSKSAWAAVAARAEAATGMDRERHLFGDEPSLATGPVQDGMAALHSLFQKAPELGSLINPRALVGGSLLRADFKALRQTLLAVLRKEKSSSDDVYERTVVADGMARAVELLDSKYTLVITNVPFLARAKQSAVLRQFGKDSHSAAKGDLATIFASSILRWLDESGTQALVAPQNWLFLTNYQKFRERLLKTRTYNLAARLGPAAFETVSGHVVNVSLIILSAEKPSKKWQMSGLDVSATLGSKPIQAAEKATLLASSAPVHSAKQEDQLQNIDKRILLAPASNLPLLMTLADYGKGSVTGDKPRFIFCCWEVPLLRSPPHVKWANSPASFDHWTGRSEFCKVPLDSSSIREQIGSGINGHRVFGRTGVAVNKISRQPFLYAGEVFDDNVGPICPRQSSAGLARVLWVYVSSPEYAKAIRQIDQKLNVTAATLVKVPFDLNCWQRVAEKQYPTGLPEPYSDDPTQWLFHGHPCGSVVWDENAKKLADGPLRTDDTVLHVAVARLLGYRWPAEHDEGMELADESRAWIARARELDQFADSDGIVCIPAIGGERSAQDRLRYLLRAAYGAAQWSAATERVLLDATRGKGRVPASIDNWLRNGFFEQHCRLFRNRPFVWHVWDGRRDGFHALVNYHRLAGPDGEGRRTLESLAYRYLGNWIEKQRAEQQEGKAGADARLAAALNLQQQLERIAAGEPPLDIFVRWRPIHRQPVGWEPDIDDGVRLNIRPFMRAELRFGGRKGAGILRWKPNIKWGKDRGKEPEYHKDTAEHIRPRDDFPWFWGCPGGGTERQRTDFHGGPDFDGNRWNDLHYTRAAKEAARAAAR